jgi:2-aminoadipate transaminase
MATLRREGRRVKMLYLVPNFQNPTGLLLGLKKRQAVLEWAIKSNLLVVEDDPYRDLYFPDVSAESDTRPIAADDRNGQVVYLSSFSKTVAPGFRMAWMHAPREVLAKFELAKQASDLCSGNFDQRVIYEVCRRGLLETHLPKLRAHYQHKRDAMVQAIERHLQGRVTWALPRGGFFLWVALSGGLKSSDVAPLAREQGVIYVDGSAFFVDGSGHDFMRLSFSAPSPDLIDEGVARLAAAISRADSRRGASSPAATAR